MKRIWNVSGGGQVERRHGVCQRLLVGILLLSSCLMSWGADLPPVLYISGWGWGYDGIYIREYDDYWDKYIYDQMDSYHSIWQYSSDNYWSAWWSYYRDFEQDEDGLPPHQGTWRGVMVRTGEIVPTPKVYPMELPDSGNPDPNHALTREPINTVSGNMVLNDTDLILPAPGLALQLSRFYNSGLPYINGAVGPRWTHCWDWSLTQTTRVTTVSGISLTNSCVDIRTGDGRTLELVQYGTSEVWRAYRDIDWTVTKLTNDTFRLDIPPASQWLFDSNGVLCSVVDLAGNALSMTYTNTFPSNRLTRIDHSCGQYLTFSYTGDLLTGVNTPSNSFYVAYAYNGTGEMTNATVHTSAGSGSTRYAYDANNHSLTQRVDATGDLYRYTYATNGSGQSTSRCTGMALNDDYYQHTVAYYTNSAYSEITYTRQGTEQTFQNHYDTNTLRITKTYGPGTTNLATTYTLDSMYLDVTEELVEDNTLTPAESLRIARTYDDHHNALTEALGYCGAATNTWEYEWHPQYQTLAATTDPEGHGTEFDYGTNGLVSVMRVLDSGGLTHESRFAYTSNGALAAVTNANGHWVQFENDSFGNPTSAIPQVGPSTFYTYTSLGHLRKIEMPPLMFTPEGGDPGSTNGTWSYRVTLFDTDERGQVSKITYPDTSFETFKYDLLGNLTNHVDTGGRTTRFAYGPASHLASMTRTLTLGGSNQTVTTSIEHDNQFNTVTIRDPLDRAVETYALDLQDRPIAITNIEGQVMSINYGLGNFIRSITRYDGTSVSNAYDIAGNLTQVRYPDTTNTFSYLKNNLLRTAANSLGTVSNAYNAANRLTTAKTVAPNGTVSYTYFPAGQVSNVTSVAGTVTYALDGADRAESIAAPSGTFAYTFNTNNGLAAGMQCTNNGLNVAYSYDSLDRVTGITWRNASNEVLRSFSYTFNSAGMITGVTREDGQSVDYGYDSLDRLTDETQRDSVNNVVFDESISYDLAGNRSSKTRDGVTVSYTRGAGNRLTNWAVTTTNLSAVVDVVGAANEPIGTAERYGQLWVSNAVSVKPMVEGTNFYALGFPVGLGTQQIVAAICDIAGNTTLVTNSVYMTIVTNADYGFNAAGCVTSMVYSGVQYSRSVSLSWNGQYQLASVATNGTMAESYGWDALGRMACIAQGTTTNWLMYDGDLVVADLNSTGGLVRSYVWGPGIDNLLSMTVHTGTTAKTYYALTDQQRSVHAMVDETGAIVESYRFDAWGRVLGIYDGQGVPLMQSAIGNRFLWQGKPYSFQSGLYCNRSRFYDPVVGRFISNDPSGITGGLNGYTYCENDPVNRFDPDGMDWLDNAANFSAGFADTISFGLTSAVRKAGNFDQVDRRSLSYKGGVGAGIAHSIAMGGGGILKGGSQGLKTLLRDPRKWKSISEAFWKGGANGRHLHHWFITRACAKDLPLWAQRIANGGWNTVVLSGRFNSWMNGATPFRQAVEYGLRFVIAGSLSAPTQAWRLFEDSVPEGGRCGY